MNILALATAFFLQTTQITELNLMDINPQERANDYLSAVNFIIANKGQNTNISLNFFDGTSISRVRSIELMPDATLLVVNFNTGRTIDFRIVTVESIKSITFVQP